MLRLVCCGALTNAALLITLFPEISSMLDIVLMGGALGVGNTVRWC
jgi:inosine-uridine nucleoside N-ribohydrolase